MQRGTGDQRVDTYVALEAWRSDTTMMARMKDLETESAQFKKMSPEERLRAEIPKVDHCDS